MSNAVKGPGHGWIGVDLDGTLAEYDVWRGISHVGKPIKPMLWRVKRWLEKGYDVRIFTARCAEGESAVGPIKAWCAKHLGVELPVTNVKDFAMIEMWDDRAIAVDSNEGTVLGGKSRLA